MTMRAGPPGERQSEQKKQPCVHSVGRQGAQGWGTRDHDCLTSTSHRKVQPLSLAIRPGALMVYMDNDGWKPRPVAQENRIKGQSRGGD